MRALKARKVEFLDYWWSDYDAVTRYMENNGLDAVYDTDDDS
jgi:hypothetical protein